jgi:hypothetical protein
MTDPNQGPAPADTGSTVPPEDVQQGNAVAAPVSAPVDTQQTDVEKLEAAVAGEAERVTDRAESVAGTVSTDLSSVASKDDIARLEDKIDDIVSTVKDGLEAFSKLGSNPILSKFFGKL